MVINFFNYEAALGHYLTAFDGMRRWRRGHVQAIAKPVLLLAITQGVIDGTFAVNRFEFDRLEPLYNRLFQCYFLEGQQVCFTPMHTPFYHLQTDGFWHLVWRNGAVTTKNSPSRSWIRSHVDYGRIDPELWIVMRHPEYAQRLRDHLVQIITTLPSAHDASSMAAEPRHGHWLKSLLTLLTAI